MNLLIEDTTDYILVGGKKIKIQTDFFLWIRFLYYIEEKDTNKIAELFCKILDIETMPDNFADILTAMKEWLFGNKEQSKPTKNNSTVNKQAISFKQDGDIIYIEMWRYFSEMLKRGITYHEGMKIIENLMVDENTELHHRGFARCGDFSKLDKETKKYWQKERVKYAIKQSQESIDEIFSKGMR